MYRWAEFLLPEEYEAEWPDLGIVHDGVRIDVCWWTDAVVADDGSYDATTLTRAWLGDNFATDHDEWSPPARN